MLLADCVLGPALKLSAAAGAAGVGEGGGGTCSGWVLLALVEVSETMTGGLALQSASSRPAPFRSQSRLPPRKPLRLSAIAAALSLRIRFRRFLVKFTWKKGKKRHFIK